MSSANSVEKIFLGLSGIVLPYPKYKFPEEFQQLSRLAIYATYFNSIEINASFYKIPQRKTIEKWAQVVPDNFRFTIKLHQDFTHCKGLVYPTERISDFIDAISVVGQKKGCVLIQFPPGLKAGNIDQLKCLLKDLSEAAANEGWTFAAEFRDDGWYNDDTFDLLRSYDVALVIQDIPRSASPSVITSQESVYVRFHGPTGTYRGSYSDEFLEEYASYIVEWADEGKTVFVYFNNTAGDAFHNARTLKQSIEEKLRVPGAIEK